MSGRRKESRAGCKGGKVHLTSHTPLDLGIWRRNGITFCFLETSPPSLDSGFERFLPLWFLPSVNI